MLQSIYRAQLSIERSLLFRPCFQLRPMNGRSREMFGISNLFRLFIKLLTKAHKSSAILRKTSNAAGLNRLSSVADWDEYCVHRRKL